ncbi:transcriptional regulator, LysR family [Lachnoanaerobaculum saburreum F0468]|uniref:Transcriptional regulator, LysR family n=2 Tax=Lachnoanaerobaculum saburreum TaxID=467210 RepID=I0R4B3_9FIRM|nr:LysR family transcriptional regulator [Lachnoanaerobaculum saburreum]EFU76527.1 transcriptional regulator, LysR family [Lachnoanaerobaculum saburreum DSM 3986]EIC94521.1 transcriptional regulator, LysR family [Lachnoanaerobaculum saburreum F0468]RKW37338.1 MAG: LysR family transcriptional regulator [Lachnospiraceae bacterium]
MTLQQLKYVITIAECGSITSAAKKLLVAQPSLSKSVSELEKEMDINIFFRNNRGIYLSEEGTRFLSYARQVVEQIELLEQQYKKKENIRQVFSMSSQHYAFVVNAFVALVKEYGESKYEFALRESRTNDIIEDVRTSRSELGVLFLSNFNRDIIQHIVKNADLKFIPLFKAKPHVFVCRNNPLVAKDKVTLSDLAPFPRLTYEQGINNSFYFSEELHSVEESYKSIIVTDRATLFNLLIGLDGYTISSGILSSDLNGTEIVSIPLESDEIMEIGYVKQIDRPLSTVSERYLELLLKYIEDYLT